MKKYKKTFSKTDEQKKEEDEGWSTVTYKKSKKTKNTVIHSTTLPRALKPCSDARGIRRCFRCGSTTHVVSFCPEKFTVEVTSPANASCPFLSLDQATFLRIVEYVVPSSRALINLSLTCKKAYRYIEEDARNFFLQNLVSYAPFTGMSWALSWSKYMIFMPQALRVKNKLLLIQATGQILIDQGEFGFSSHQLIIGRTLSEQEVRELESKIRCQLPLAFRLFLLIVGDGGAGPDYGIVPSTAQRVAELPTANQWMRHWCPETTDTIRNFRICEEGCGYCKLLVVIPHSYIKIISQIRGKKFGSILEDFSAADGGVFQVAPNFLTWYEV